MNILPRNLFLTLVVCAALPGTLLAQPTGHYCPGSEGLLGPSVPGPGWYVRDYNVFYTADQVNNGSGQSAGPGNLNVFTYAQVPRLIWVTDQKFLGADAGVNALLPLVYQDSAIRTLLRAMRRLWNGASAKSCRGTSTLARRAISK